MMTLTIKPCAYCNTLSTGTLRLKRCGKCKDVNYCNKTCQKADWRSHKAICDQTTSIIATLKEVLLEDGGQLKLVKRTLPQGSFLHKKMPPTPELPLGAHRLVDFDAEFLAKISQLSQEEQEKAKHGFVSEMLATEAAWMTPEMREEQRLEMAAAGRLQAELAVKLDAKKARDAEGK